MLSTTHSLSVSGVDVSLEVRDTGAGHTFLLLHGGAGPLSVAPFAQLLGAERPARVLAPTHPGFGGTPRPEALATPRALAELYVALLDKLDLHDVTLVGNSIGGWVASEMALLKSPRVGRIILVDAVGITVDEHPVADVFSLTLPELMALSYHDPVKFRIDPSSFTDAQRAGAAANRAALAVYGGAMTDPTLRGRLRDVSIPALVLWGEADRVVDVTYGKAFADAIPNARFNVLPRTGHVPQIETPAELLRAIWDYSSEAASAAASAPSA